MALADYALRHGRYSEAKDLLDTLVDAMEPNATLFWKRSRALFHLGDTQNAYQDARRCVELDDSFVAVALLLCDTNTLQLYRAGYISKLCANSLVMWRKLLQRMITANNYFFQQMYFKIRHLVFSHRTCVYQILP